MSYKIAREQFIATMGREGLPYMITCQLLRAATTLNHYAELSCSSEAADRDRVRCPGEKRIADCCCDSGASAANTGMHERVPRHVVREHRLEQRIAKILPNGWRMHTEGDPRGYVLRVIPPSYAARNEGRDRWNRDMIGVPSGDSRLRF